MHQASNREIEGGRTKAAVTSQHSHSQENNNGQSQSQQQDQESQNDDFLEQILSTIPNCSWPPTPNDLPSPTSNPNTKIDMNDPNFKSRDSHPDDDSAAAFQFPFDDPSLVSKLQQPQQMTEVTAKSLLLQQQQHQQQFLLSRRSPADAMLSLPLSLGNPDSVDASAFKSQTAAEASVHALYNGLAGSLHANAQPANQPQFHPPPPPPQGGSAGGGQKVSASTGGSNGAGAPQRQRVRARRGQATDPHSIAERLRRERIAERMKALQELVPNANKTDKASMLDEIIDYVKFLQLQVKVLSMSRLGGASAVAPLITDMNSEGVGRSNVSNAGNQTAPTNDGMTITEHQVAKLMEEDMGSAMQYLQGKGLCLMPISLASAISTTTTSLARTPGRPHVDNNGNHHHDNVNDTDHHHHHHPLFPAMPLSNGEGDPTHSSIKDLSTS